MKDAQDLGACPPHLLDQERTGLVRAVGRGARRLPASAITYLLDPACPLIVLPQVERGRITRVEAALPEGDCVLHLDSRLLDRPRREAIGIIAHELAHVCTEVAPVNEELDNGS